jgi:hypothetical protein
LSATPPRPRASLQPTSSRGALNLLASATKRGGPSKPFPTLYFSPKVLRNGTFVCSSILPMRQPKMCETTQTKPCFLIVVNLNPVVQKALNPTPSRGALMSSRRNSGRYPMSFMPRKLVPAVRHSRPLFSSLAPLAREPAHLRRIFLQKDKRNIIIRTHAQEPSKRGTHRP